MENTYPLVTIIVVSYNHSRFINENLDSIKNQTYTNIQLIVADDASPDNSVDIYENWLTENKYPALKNYHQKNTGLATTLNECIELAEGKYIKLIAADDCLEKTYIEKCVTELELNNSHLVFTNAKEIDNNNQEISAHYFSVPNYDNIAELKSLLINGNFISGSTLMTSKALYKMIGLYSRLTLLEDYNLVLRALVKNLNITYIPDDLIRYRRHENNITKQKFEKLQIETIKEKIIFDKKGEYKDIIHFNIRQQKTLNNPHLKDLKKAYLNYKGFYWKFLIINFYPKLYSIFKI